MSDNATRAPCTVPPLVGCTGTIAGPCSMSATHKRASTSKRGRCVWPVCDIHAEYFRRTGRNVKPIAANKSVTVAAPAAGDA